MGVSNHASEQCFETSALLDLDTMSKRQTSLILPRHNKLYTAIFLFKKIVHSVIHIILFLIQNEEYLSSSRWIGLSAQKQYSVEEKMKVILSTINPI